MFFDGNRNKIRRIVGSAQMLRDDMMDVINRHADAPCSDRVDGGTTPRDLHLFMEIGASK